MLHWVCDPFGNLRVMLSGVERMRKNKRDFPALVVGLLSLSLLFYTVLNFAPDKSLKILDFPLPPIPIFFLLFFIGMYELFKFLLNQRRGFLIAFFATLYLILRLNKLNHLFFALLIISLFIVFELLFRKRK